LHLDRHLSVCGMGIIGVIWAIIGVSALLLNPILRLAPRGLEAMNMELSGLQWALLIIFALFMIYSEGVRGFQKNFSPRTAARLRVLREKPTLLRVVLAPFFAMGFFQANRKTRIVVWVILIMVICLIALVSLLSQPWRGIIDVGVVLGLSWGLISFWIFTIKALTAREFSHSPQMNEPS